MAHNGGDVKFLDGFFTANGIFPDDTYDAGDLKRLYGPLPSLEQIKATRKVKVVRELIRAWDPVAQKKPFGNTKPRRACVATTAASCRRPAISYFKAGASGGLWVYAADSGKVLKVIHTGSHIMAAPTTYAVNGEQYVAVQVGYGGTAIAEGSFPPSSAALKYENANRVIAFKLGGGPVPTPKARVTELFEKPPEQAADKEAIHAGEIKFIEECSRCHTLGSSVTPDLRRLNPGLHAAFKDIVLRGALAPAGMERFDDILSEKDVDNIHAYLIDQSWVAYRAQETAARK